MGIVIKNLPNKLRKRIAYCYAILNVFGALVGERIIFHNRMTIEQQG